MNKETDVFLKHILESISNIEEFTKGISKEDFMNSTKTQDAVVRRIEIMGEATKNLPKDFREKYKEVPWSEIARTRDKLIHGYFGVDYNITWKVIEEKLPDIKKKIKVILEQEAKKQPKNNPA